MEFLPSYLLLFYKGVGKDRLEIFISIFVLGLYTYMYFIAIVPLLKLYDTLPGPISGS